MSCGHLQEVSGRWHGLCKGLEAGCVPSCVRKDAEALGVGVDDTKMAVSNYTVWTAVTLGSRRSDG